MRRAAVSIAAVLLLAACEQSHTPTLAPASTSTGASRASAPPEPSQRRGQETRALKKVALVEAKGKQVESDAFISHLLSEISDRELFQVVDARLSGAGIGALAADPQGREARAFKEQFGAEALMGTDIGECRIGANRTVIPSVSQEGYRTERVLITYDAECAVSVRLVDAEDGHVISLLDAKGHAVYRGDNEETGSTPAEEEAAREAATKIAKKLKGVVGR